MARRARRRGGYRAAGEGGAYWMSYSDLMAAVMLFFILVLFASVYRAYNMEEIMTADLMRQSGLLEQKEVELDESISKLSEREEQIVSQAAQLLLQQQKLDSLAEALKIQESELGTAQEQLDTAQVQLDSQRAVIDDKQRQLDALVGVRGNIISSLGDTLKKNGLVTKIDPVSGAITFESGIFFTQGSDELTQEGKDFLDRFVPLYLNVLLSPENKDYISEIIIEGHTDSSASYSYNLDLSQRRAFNVAEYITGDEYHSIGADTRQQLRSIINASGRSFSDLILHGDGTENMEASRRVEFKFRMKDTEMLEEMNRLLQSMQEEGDAPAPEGGGN